MISISFFRRARIAVALLTLIGTGGCSDAAGPGDGVLIRMENASPFAFDEVLVRFSAQDELYGSLPVGGVTDYRRADGAYSYAYVRVRSGSKTVVQQPIDFVGETPLAPGRYTYVIELTSLDQPYTGITRLKRE